MIAAGESIAGRPAIDRVMGNMFARNTFLVLANSVVNATGGAAFWFIAARTYSPMVVGLSTAGTSVLILLATFSQLGLGVGVIRYARSLGPQRSRRIAAVFMATAATGLAAACLCWKLILVLAPGLAPIFAFRWDPLLFVVSCMAWALSVQYDSYLMSRCLMSLMVCKNTIIAVCRLVAIIALHHPTGAMIIAVTGLSGLVGIAFLWPVVARITIDEAATSVPVVATKTLVSYAFWNHWTTLIGATPALLLPSLIINVVGAFDAAAYYLAWSLFGGLMMIPAAISQTLLAVRSQHVAAHTAPVARGVRVDCAVLLVAALFVPLAFTILMLTRKEYATHGAIVLVILAVGFWPYYRALVLQTEMRLRGSQKLLAVVYAVGQVTTVAGSLPLLGLMGIAGAALAWTLGQGLLLALLYWSVRMSTKAGHTL